MNEEVKQAVLDFMEKKRKIKTRLPMIEIVKGLKGQCERREVKITITQMVDAGIIMVWSSGSSSYYMLPDDFKKLCDAGADGQA